MKTAQAKSGIYPFYVVGIFLIAYVFSFVDRTVLGLLVDPVRKGLSISDVEMSFLLGAAFAVLYIVGGFPLGRWADCGSRRNLIVAGISVWSAATVSCAFVDSFWGLFVARAFVGVGEAALLPAVYSLIPDYFRKERVGLALAIFACGVTLGGGAGLIIVGHVIELAEAGRLFVPFAGPMQPWQIAFFMVGMPGLGIALLVRLTVTEPSRSFAGGREAVPTARQSLGYLIVNKGAILPVLIGYAIHGITVYGYVTWGPSYFIRLHGMSPAEVGLFIGLCFAGLGTTGNLAGGLLCDALRARGRADAPIRVVLLSVIVGVPALMAAYLSTSKLTAMVFFAVGLFVASAKLGVAPASIHALFPSRLHGQATALYVALVSFFGLVIGPTLVAWLAETVFGGVEGTGRALATASGVASFLSVVLILLPWAKISAHIQTVAGAGRSEGSEDRELTFEEQAPAAG